MASQTKPFYSEESRAVKYNTSSQPRNDNNKVKPVERATDREGYTAGNNEWNEL